MSVPPPGTAGTTIRTGLLGKVDSAASAAEVRVATQRTASEGARRIDVGHVSCDSTNGLSKHPAARRLSRGPVR